MFVTGGKVSSRDLLQIYFKLLLNTLLASLTASFVVFISRISYLLNKNK